MVWWTFALCFRAKLLDYDVALNMTTYLKQERSYAPWVAFVDSIEYIRSSISKSGAYVLMQVCSLLDQFTCSDLTRFICPLFDVEL